MTFFKHPSQEFVYTRTYSRWIESLQRRETWPETVERYVNFIKDERGDKIPAKVLKKIYEGILNMKVMPSMRALWTAGPAAKRDNTSMYNCSYLEVDNENAFSEGLFLLMCGAGLGFGVRNSSISKLPEIPAHINSENSRLYYVEDSREGWANSVKELVHSLYLGNDLNINYNNIRASGTKLKTFGGTSSGPAPLAKLHEFIRQTFYTAKGRKLTSLECHDIMNELAIAVIAGNVRRSAEISLSDLDDIEMREAKLGEFPNRRWMANNSAVYDVKPNSSQFLKEWASLAESGTGERGIFNLGTAKNNTPKRRDSELLMGVNPSLRAGTKVLTDKGIFSIEELEGQDLNIFNLNNVLSAATCFKSGINKQLYKITLESGFDYYCTPEHKWPVVSEDSIIKKLTTDLKPGDAFPVLRKSELFNGELGSYEDGFLIGWLYGDGWTTLRKDTNKMQYGWIIANNKEEVFPIIQQKLISITGDAIEGCKRDHGIEINTTNTKIDLYMKSFGVKHKSEGVPTAIWKEGSENFRKGFIDGLFSSDGSIGKDRRISLVSSKSKLINDIKELLGFYGIISHTLYRQMVGNFPNKKEYNKLYDNYTLRISGASNINQFKHLFKFSLKAKQERVDSFCWNGSEKKQQVQNAIKIKNIELTKIHEDVWDITVFDESHCFQLSQCVTGNCGEIQLRNKGLCNLSEVVITAEDDLDSLLEKIETATWIGAIQSTFTDFPYLSKQWEENAKEERLLGVSLTGQMDNPKLMTPDNLKALKSRALKIAKKAADILEVNFSVSVTCVKPSGTVSALVNSASGLHPRFDHYYIRRYRISSLDPLFALIKDQGIELSPENGQSKEDWTTKNPAICHIYDGGEWSEDKVNTWVLKFPMAAPKGAILARDVSAIEQLEYYKMVQTNYCEHNASITVYVKEDEWLKVGSWVYDNWDSVVGISFLPYSDHAYKQAPYESITKEQYEELMANFKEIDYSQLSKYEVVDNTSGARTFACVGGGCDV